MTMIWGSGYELEQISYYIPYKGFNDWGARGYDDFIPGEVTKTAPSGYETAWSASLPRIYRI